jgi:hypothetical protein
MTVDIENFPVFRRFEPFFACFSVFPAKWGAFSAGIAAG